jgi:exopolysaccharide biosynthesis polyprenyl glycosylphosphotransferase
MPRSRRNDFLIPTLAVLIDSIAVECAFLFAYWIRFNTTILNFLPLTEDQPPLRAYIYGSFVVIPVWLLIFNARKMYGARRNVALSDELASIIKVVTLGMLVVMSAAFFYRAFSYSRVVFGLLWISSVVFLITGRAVLLNIEKVLYARGKELRNAVIIGCNETANQIAKSIFNHPLLGYRLTGYFADLPCETSSPLSSLNYLGTLSAAPDKIVSGNAELALIALKSEEHAKLYKLVQECEGINVEMMMVPDILEMMTTTANVGLKEIEGIPFIRLKGIPMTTWGVIIKRSFDILVSAVLLALLSPVFLLLSLLVKLGSNGPVFYAQERIGMDGRNFMMLKFRSMKIGAESESGPVWAKENDPRQTSLGSLLRQTSLDELPQLINVLRGEMSLVGPRPERQFFVDKFKSLVPKYLDRHRVKTGMTGWAQVNGLRGNTSLEERIRYDMYYIENWSLWFDIKILLKTIGEIFR